MPPPSKPLVSQSAIAIQAALDELPADRRHGTEHIDLINELAWELGLEDSDRARRLGEEGLELSRRADYPRGRACALRALAYCDIVRANMEDCTSKSRESLAIFESLDDVHGQSTMNDLIANVYMILGDYQKTLVYAETSRVQARTADYPRGEAYALNNMAIVFSELGDATRALGYFNEALSLFRSIPYPVGECWVRSRMGRLYLKLDQGDAALEHLKEGLRLARRHRVNLAANMVLTDIGAAYRSLGQPDRAMHYLRRSLRLYRERDFSGFYAETLLQIALLHVDSGEDDLARSLLEEGLLLVQETGEWPAAARIHECLAEIEERGGDFESSLTHFRKFHELKERIFDEESRAQAHRLEMRQRLEAADRESERLRLQQAEEARADLEKAHAEVRRLRDRLRDENRYLQEEIKHEHNFEEIITRDPKMQGVLRLVDRVPATDTTVLIQGETGTGKELLARAIHNASGRAERPLVKLNCAALPRELIESELFGHERGAFTGATDRRVGRFELANGGSLFLDEIGELPLELQPKLLRVLQEGELERLGGSETLRVDVRIIAATNRDLALGVRRGEFREDLFYRLNVFPIFSPPLRERREDLPLLVEHFLTRYAPRIGRDIESIDANDLEDLAAYDWPGNIRELENLIERALILASGPILRIPLDLSATPATELSGSEQPGGGTLRDIEKQLIERTLRDCNWIIKGPRGAAGRLGLPPSTLRDRMRQYGIRKQPADLM